MKKSLILCACLLLLLSACATRQPILSGQTLAAGGERTAEQLAVSFEKADLALRIEPASRTIRGDVAEGKGEIALPAGATWTLDPHSRLLRRARHIEEFQAYEKARKAKKAG